MGIIKDKFLIGPESITDEFLKGRPLSASSMKAFGGIEGNPKKYIDYFKQPRVDSDAFILGRAVETLIYQEFDKKRFSFEKEFQIYSPFPKRTNEAKEKWQQMTDNARANKITLIDNDMAMEAQAMADCVLQTDETRYYLDRIAKDKDGQLIIQEKLFWTNRKTKLPVIGYLDILCDIEGHLIIVDIKTSKDGGPQSFHRFADYNDYIIQVGAYLLGYHESKYQFPSFMFMVIDKSYPYDAIMIHEEPNYCERAKEEFQHILTAFRYCMDEKQFHRGRAFWDSGNGYFSNHFNRYMKLKSTSED